MLKNFNQFVKEAYVAPSLSEVEAKIDAFLKAGEIVKPEYEDLKYRANSAVEKESLPIAHKYLHGKGQENWAAFGDDVMSSVWAPHSVTELAALKNKLARSKKKSHPYYLALADFYAKWSGLADKFAKLKGITVTTTQKRAAAKVEKEVAFKKHFGDTSSLVKTLTGHLQDYLDRAAELAEINYEFHMKELAKHGWSLKAVAPEASYSKMSREEYRNAQHKRFLYQELTDAKGKGSDSDLRKRSETKLAASVAQAVKRSKDSYMAWVEKITRKIGAPVVSSKMVGKPWVGNVLTVTTNDGETQVWNTKMILNQSKYELLFNQFPSRRVK